MPEQGTPRRLLLRGPLDAEYLCICNPAAGPRKDLRRILSMIEEKLASAGQNLLITRTKYSGHASQLARRYSQGRKAVIAIGGDGTLREIAAGIDPSVPLAVVPLGTVNILAKELGIPEQAQAAIDLILKGRCRSIDVGFLRDEPFLLMVSAGLDALTVHNLNGHSKRIFGQFAYAFSAIRTSLNHKPRRYRISILDRGKRTRLVEKGYLVIVSNGRYYAGRYTINPRASLSSGKLHVMIYKKPGLIDSLRLAFTVLSGQMLHLKDVSFYDADEVIIEGRRKTPRLQFDGDKASGGPAVMTIRPAYLKLLVPRSHVAQAGRQGG